MVSGRGQSCQATESAQIVGRRRKQDASGRPAPNAPRKRGCQLPFPLIISSIESLYADELKPVGRILRKRVAERMKSDGESVVVDVAQVRSACDLLHRRGKVRVQPEDGGDWSALLVDRFPTFIDVYSSVDTYPAAMWAQARIYFENLEGNEMYLPGGRYSCAQELISRGLHFLVGCSLGKVCHIVQLALSSQKLLGYLNGSVVPYRWSQTMMKDHCAVCQQPCTTMDGSLPHASWAVARTCLLEILNTATEDGPGAVPLSNIKRIFRARFKLELSETRLGRCRLSELLQDPRFEDVCSVELHGQGYMVVPKVFSRPTAGTLTLIDKLPPYEVPIELGKQASEDVYHDQPRFSFFLDESCGVDATREEEEEEEEEADTYPDADLQVVLGQRTPAAAPTPFKFPCLSPSTIGENVRSTFIHQALPPPTPMTGARRRSSSLPKDMGSDKSAWETTCHALSFLHKPVDAHSDSTETSTGGTGSDRKNSFGTDSRDDSVDSLPIAGLSTTESSAQPALPFADPLKVWLSDGREMLDFSPKSCCGRTPVARDSRPLQCIQQLHQDETTRMEDTGVFLVSPTKLSKDFLLSPTQLSKEGFIGRQVQNTFIHAAPAPPTPLAGAMVRSRSMPKDSGSVRNSWESTCHALGFRARGDDIAELPPRNRTRTLSQLVDEGASDASFLVRCPDRTPKSAAPSPAFLMPPSPALTASPMYHMRSPRRPLFGSLSLQQGTGVLRLSEYI